MTVPGPGWPSAPFRRSPSLAAGSTSPAPFRAEHVGSLLRPPELIAARHAVREGRLAREALGPLEDRAIRDVVRLQMEVGLPVVTDGEHRRGAFFTHFVRAVEGLTVRPTAFVFRNDDGQRVVAHAPYTEGRLRRVRGIATGEHAFLAGLLAGAVRPPVAKVTLPAPPYVNFLGGRERVSAEAYPDLDQYWADLIAVYRAELADLGAAGARYVQLDEVPLAMLADPAIRDQVRALGEDPDRLAARYLEAVGAAAAARPAGMRLGLHLCRGNYRGRWLAEGGYEWMAERLFAIPDVDVYLMEFDSPRAGDFGPLRHVPPGKTVALGLVSTKTAVLEPADLLRRRIDEAARVCPLERLALAPQCGFATNLTGSPLTVDDQRRKLALVVEVARAVWG